MKYAIIDPHVHVWKHDPKYPFAPGAHPPPEDRTPEMLLELMKANNVERTVIIQVIHFKWDNSYLADVLKQYPQYFKGVARINPEDPAAPDHVTELMKKPGFHGIRISPGAGENGNWITGPLMPPLWKRCDDLKVPMTVLVPITRVPDVEKLIATSFRLSTQKPQCCKLHQNPHPASLVTNPYPLFANLYEQSRYFCKGRGSKEMDG